ncbi:MAG TPA: NAD-dependent epimerase/dehydratase family protein [Nitrospirales bacterium]|jgi:UDP-glucose 4-epimerase|nr:NAD-dependent epimerase/dehydratase family protein [Nitrospirales bacterium]
MKILVTGGAGFIGSHIVDRLVQEGYEIAVVDNLSTGKRRHVNRAAKFYRTDIRSWWLERVFRRERPVVVCHHAAQMDVRRSVRDPVFDAETNILGTLNVLRHAIKYGVRKVLFASSGGAVYGETEKLPVSEDHPVRPASPYGISKAVGDEYLRYFREADGLEFVSLRYANVYGPRQDPHGEAGVVGIFTQKMLLGEQPIINGNGRQTRDFVYVDDVVEANVAALNKAAHGIYNVGTGRETSVNELFSLLAGLINPAIREVHGPAKKGEQQRIALDASKFHRELDWEPKVSLEDGLARTVEYYRKTERAT